MHNILLDEGLQNVRYKKPLYIFNIYLKFFLANKKRLWIQGRDSLQENIMQHEQPGGARDDLTNKIKA